MNEKKVIVVIVEGSSDESAIGGILKEYFSSNELQFIVTHGDITSDKNVKPNNVISKINEKLNDIRSKYGYKLKDFARIIHITDTDGTFSSGCVIQADVKATQYYEDHIETKDVEKIIKRNKQKSEVMCRLYLTGNISGIKYNLYYNSCNLEHVLFNELKDFTDEDRERLSDDFSDTYENKLDDFLGFISDPVFAVKGT